MAADPGRARHFGRIIERLPDRLNELLAAPSRPRKEHPPITQAAGIYLFSEHGAPVYVGQTRNLRRRLADHTNQSGGSETASFAFKIVTEDAGPAASGMTRKEVERRFEPHFRQAKERVSRMDVQFIVMDDPIERTIFEMYAALHLGTERYNSFETH